MDLAIKIVRLKHDEQRASLVTKYEDVYLISAITKGVDIDTTDIEDYEANIPESDGKLIYRTIDKKENKIAVPLCLIVWKNRAKCPVSKKRQDHGDPAFFRELRFGEYMLS